MTSFSLRTAIALAAITGLAASASAQITISNPAWKISSTAGVGSDTRTWFGTGNAERGLAYNAATGNLLVAARTSANRVRIISSATGADVGFVPDAGFTGGGGAVLNKVGATADGVIFACNLDTATGFKIYRAADESTTFTTVYTQVAGDDPNSDREGDDLIVRRLSNGMIQLITTNAAASGAVIIYTSGDNGLTFTRARFPFTGLTFGSTPNVEFDPVNATNLIVRSSGNTNNTGVIDGATSSVTLLADNLARGCVLGARISATNSSHRIIGYTGGNTTNAAVSRNSSVPGTNVDQFTSTRSGGKDAAVETQTLQANANASGDVVFVGTTAYILNTNNSITRNDGVTVPVSMSEFAVE